jgi:hypothetical protein
MANFSDLTLEQQEELKNISIALCISVESINIDEYLKSKQ